LSLHLAVYISTIARDCLINANQIGSENFDIGVKVDGFRMLAVKTSMKALACLVAGGDERWRMGGLIGMSWFI
jgi:hypothetical protein